MPLSWAEHAAQVLDTAYQYLFIMACFLVTAYLMHVYRGVLQGLGNSIAPMLSGIVEFAARVSCALFLPLASGMGIRRCISRRVVLYSNLSS